MGKYFLVLAFCATTALGKHYLIETADNADYKRKRAGDDYNDYNGVGGGSLKDFALQLAEEFDFTFTAKDKEILDLVKPEKGVAGMMELAAQGRLQDMLDVGKRLLPLIEKVEKLDKARYDEVVEELKVTYQFDAITLLKMLKNVLGNGGSDYSDYNGGVDVKQVFVELAREFDFELTARDHELLGMFNPDQGVTAFVSAVMFSGGMSDLLNLGNRVKPAADRIKADNPARYNEIVADLQARFNIDVEGILGMLDLVG